MVVDLIGKLIEVPTYQSKALTLLNRVLLRRYPQVEDSVMITMEEVIDWNLWPNIFSILGKHFAYACFMYSSLLIIVAVYKLHLHFSLYACGWFCYSRLTM